MKLKDSPKIEYWSDGFAHSFSGLDTLGGAPSEWFLTNIGKVGESNDGKFILRLYLRRKDDMETSKYLRSKDESFLQKLSEGLVGLIDKSWEEIGNLEIPED